MTTTAVATKKPPTLAGLIEQMKPEIARVRPAQLNPDRMARIATTCVRQTPALARTTPESFLGALLTASQLGLEPGGPRPGCYLVPYGSVCTFIPSWFGLVDLARRSGQVVDVWAEIVYENDVFDYTLGLDRAITKHQPPPLGEPRGEAIGVYAAAELVSGGKPFVVMAREAVEKIRDRSRAGKNGPWVTDWEAMAKKGLALDTPLPTPDGWTTMGEISAGDEVFDVAGQRTRVTAVSEVKNLPCYLVTFANGEQITCDHEHIWVSKLGMKGPRTPDGGREPEQWKSRAISELYEAKLSGRSVTVPVAQPLVTDVEKLPIDPWLLGYWLGNGNRQQAAVTCHADDASEVAERITATEFALGAVRPDGRSKAVCVRIRGNMVTRLRDEGILGTKRIPAAYRRAAEWQRRELLAGLMDSDGHLDSARGRARFASTDKYLADLVAELAASLGEVVTRIERQANGYGKTVTSYEVQWQPVVNPVTLTRKARNFKPRQIAAYRSIKSIEKVESVPTRCLAVESQSRTYLAGLTMVPTHNTAVKQLCKWLPQSAEMQVAVAQDGAVRTEITRLDQAVVPTYIDADGEDAPAPAGQLGVGGQGAPEPDVRTLTADDLGIEPPDPVPGPAEPPAAEAPADVVMASRKQLGQLKQIRDAEKYDADLEWFGFLSDLLGEQITKASDITGEQADRILATFQTQEN